LRALTGISGGIAAAAWTTGALAHGFGERYELPLPLALFLGASGLVVLASFAAMALFFRSGSDLSRSPRVRLAFLPSPAAGAALRVIGVLGYALVIGAGLFGAQRAFKNIAPVLVWVIAWVGFAYVAALLGNLWAVMNPLDTLFRWAGGDPRPPRLRYPEALGQWPAVALFLALVWVELVSESADAPAALSLGILAYSALTWTGMWLFGREEWLRRGEVLSVVYGYIARFAPLEARGRDVHLRPYAVGLLRGEPLAPSETVFVVLMLSAVSFDGFLETPAWAHVVEHFGAEHAWLKTWGIAVGLLVFVAAYLSVCVAVARLGGGPPRPLARTAGRFVLTLVPIAIAYHVAHYLSFFLMASQYLVPLASDPFGVGWDLFGGGHQFIRPLVIDARAVWYISVVAIVAGHVVAVVLAHAVAMREFATRGAALRSQLPMVALMVGYTMTSLWIIAQPITTMAR
jgi:hypothetical protein